MTAVRCVSVCKTYRQGDQLIRALDHVDLEIDEGDVVFEDRGVTFTSSHVSSKLPIK